MGRMAEVLDLVSRSGRDDLATVRVGRLGDGSLVEYVDSVQPPVPRREKWVLIVSTLKGCPVGCPMCDAGGSYAGRLSAEEILAQLDCMVEERYPDRRVPVRRLKVQFARMGDPAMNPAVLEVLERLPGRYGGTSVMPCISTIAPAGCDRFMDALAGLKRRLYPSGRFQMQLSLHTTSEERRPELVPARTWSFARMAGWSRGFFAPGDRKVTLNFAPVEGFPMEPGELAGIFEPDMFFVKLTPVNPTASAVARGLRGAVDPDRPEEAEALADRFRGAGYETLLSIGETEENRIGSNCGMYVTATGDEPRSEDAGRQAVVG
jgi:23S rRNA (adenine2503-C2)-methyltransferase